MFLYFPSFRLFFPFLLPLVVLAPSRALGCRVPFLHALADAFGPFFLLLHLLLVLLAFVQGKAALTFRPIAPTLVRVGGQSNGLTVQRAGTVMLEFAARDGPRADFDWQNKQLFALSATECGEMLDAMDRAVDVRLVHDPNANTPRAGQSLKTLRISPARDGGHFFTFMGTSQSANQGGVQPYGANGTGNATVTISIPVSPAEGRTVKVLLTDLIPKLLAWDALKPFLADGEQQGRGGRNAGADSVPF